MLKLELTLRQGLLGGFLTGFREQTTIHGVDTIASRIPSRLVVQKNPDHPYGDEFYTSLSPGRGPVTDLERYYVPHLAALGVSLPHNGHCRLLKLLRERATSGSTMKPFGHHVRRSHKQTWSYSPGPPMFLRLWMGLLEVCSTGGGAGGSREEMAFEQT